MKQLPRVLVLLVLGLASVFTQASMSLSALFMGSTIQVGDTLFDQWELIDSVDPFAGLIDLSQIMVTGIADDPVSPGLDFAANGQLAVAGDDFLLLNFTYRMRVLEPTMPVDASTLELGSFSSSQTDELIVIQQTVCGSATCDPFNPDILTENEAYVDELFGEQQLVDTGGFAPQEEIWTEIFVLVDVIDAQGGAEINDFQQFYSQPSPVPVPAALWLFGSALLSLVVAAKRNTI